MVTDNPFPSCCATNQHKRKPRRKLYQPRGQGHCVLITLSHDSAPSPSRLFQAVKIGITSYYWMLWWPVLTSGIARNFDFIDAFHQYRFGIEQPVSEINGYVRVHEILCAHTGAYFATHSASACAFTTIRILVKFYNLRNHLHPRLLLVHSWLLLHAV